MASTVGVSRAAVKLPSDPPPVLMSAIPRPTPSPMRAICSHSRQVASEGTMGIRFISPRTSTRTPSARPCWR